MKTKNFLKLYFKKSWFMEVIKILQILNSVKRHQYFCQYFTLMSRSSVWHDKQYQLLLWRGLWKLSLGNLPVIKSYVVVLIYNRRRTSSKKLALHFLKIVIFTFYKVMSYFTSKIWLGFEKSSGLPQPSPVAFRSGY